MKCRHYRILILSHSYLLQISKLNCIELHINCEANTSALLTLTLQISISPNLAQLPTELTSWTEGTSSGKKWKLPERKCDNVRAWWPFKSSFNKNSYMLSQNFVPNQAKIRKMWTGPSEKVGKKRGTPALRRRPNVRRFYSHQSTQAVFIALETRGCRETQIPGNSGNLMT